jgi:hypothetical protein
VHTLVVGVRLAVQEVEDAIVCHQMDNLLQGWVKAVDGRLLDISLGLYELRIVQEINSTKKHTSNDPG